MRVGPGRDPLFFIAARTHGPNLRAACARARGKPRRAAADRRERPRAQDRPPRRADAAHARACAWCGSRFGRPERDGADHGRTAGRNYDHRRLRARQRRLVAAVRRRGADRRRLSAGRFPRRASTGRWCAISDFRRAVGHEARDRDGGSGRRPQALSRRASRRSSRATTGPIVRLRLSPRRERRGGERRSRDRRHRRSAAGAHRRADPRHAEAREGGEETSARRSVGRGAKAAPKPPRAAPERRADETEARRDPAADSAAGRTEGEDDGRQRQQTRTLADRRRRRAREVDRPLDRARLDGRRDAEGGALALRSGDRGARRDQPEDRRDPLLAPAAGRRRDRERRHADHARRRAEEEPLGADRRLDRRIAAAVRLRPHPRPGLQAGAGAEDPRGRARQAIRSVQGPHRRDHQRPGQAGRIRQCRRRPRRRRAARRWSAATN